MNVRPILNRALLFGAATLLAAGCGETPQLPTDSEPTVEQVQPQNGDVAAALVVHERHTPDLMNIEGVVGTGLGVDGEEPRIRVYTVHGNVRGIPDQVDNVPIERVVTGLIVAGDIKDPTSRERPAPNGFSIGHPDITAGTLGALVRGSGDVCYALSNNHVLANSNNASIGDNALQPGPFDGGSDPADAIGTLADFEPISFSSDNTMDAAIAEFFDAAEATGATPDYAYGAPGTSPTGASPGMSVQKFGRTTGHQIGQVEEVNVTVSVCYVTRGPFMCAQAATFVDQFTITPGAFSAGGDSGSLIVTNSTGKNPLGLLFAGSDTRTIANPIEPVLSRFGVGIETNPANCSNGDGGDPPANQPPTADFSFTTDGLSVLFTDNSSDTDGTVVAWSWNFGDGNGSTAQNPSHTYAADGTYSVSLTVQDDDGATDVISQDVTVADGGDPPGGFTLSVNAYKVRGLQKADLSWSGATSTNVDIRRSGSLVTTTANDGFYTDNIDARGGGSYTYEVCEAGTSTCSNEATASF
jgi:PKD repeat protein